MTEPLRWPLEALWQTLAPRMPGFSAELLASVDSTNSECMRRLRAGQHEPLLLVALAQTAGRGRMGRSWQSEGQAAGASLTFSLALPMAPRSWSGLSLAVGLSVADSLQAELPPTGSRTPRIALKWPNDLWLQGQGAERKLGGILVETASWLAPGAAGGAMRWVVVGVGLNVAPRDGGGFSTPPGSLHELDARWDAPTALGCVVEPLVDALQAFERQGFAPLVARYAARDALTGRQVRLSDGREGLADGVGPEGALRVRGPMGAFDISSAEVSVRPLPADGEPGVA
ncbi:MAG: biotin--[acetyl-CoA-carboxylase] ligase [Simplicispira sp.]|nr:biotin--[acetyl-CoA-carboxylase] ligase [Simplicispira sp.]